MSPEGVLHPGSLPGLMNPPSPKGRPVFIKIYIKKALFLKPEACCGLFPTMFSFSSPHHWPF